MFDVSKFELHILSPMFPRMCTDILSHIPAFEACWLSLLPFRELGKQFRVIQSARTPVKLDFIAGAVDYCWHSQRLLNRTVPPVSARWILMQSPPTRMRVALI